MAAKIAARPPATRYAASRIAVARQYHHLMSLKRDLFIVRLPVPAPKVTLSCFRKISWHDGVAPNAGAAVTPVAGAPSGPGKPAVNLKAEGTRKLGWAWPVVHSRPRLAHRRA